MRNQLTFPHRISFFSSLVVLFFSCPLISGQSMTDDSSHFHRTVEVYNSEDSVKLVGTLSCPDSTGSFPLAVFISGSGPQDRYSSIGKHRPFLLISQRLNAIGIATISFDDRGTGQSTGSIFSSGMQKELKDHQLIIHAIPDIETKHNIHFTKIGLIGHSLGGIVALELSENNPIDFSILLATPFEKGSELMIKQKRNIESFYQELSRQEKEMSVRNMKRLYEFVNENKDDKSLDSLLFEEINKIDTGDHYTTQFINGLVHQMTQTSLFDIITHDPTEAGYDFTSPTLFMYGSKDIQVPPAGSIINLDRISQDTIPQV
jgi:pimeloyl-ACP methyl ester carboxylesterase